MFAWKDIFGDYGRLIPNSEVDSIRLRTMIIKPEIIAEFKRQRRAPYQPSAQRWG
jgi:hypothetical protein